MILQYGLSSLRSKLLKTRISRKCDGVKRRDLRFLVSDGREIKIMLYRFGGNDDISDVQLVAERSCDAGVDDALRVEAILEDLHAQRGIHFPDAALNADNVYTVQQALAKPHSRILRVFRIRHGRLQRTDLRLHCSYDSDRHSVSP